ncbi:MAG TPA: hypothetical protein VND54_05380 [Candidatus Saccharimonadales bacterium]|nr:hypothetical protein [Candidatus Saccharimonadales bacterium]
MGVSAPLLSAAGVIGAAVAMMADGRRAVAIAVVFLAAGLAPTAATFGGAPGVAVIGACAIAAVVLAWAGWLGGRVLPWLSGLDPTIPAFAPSDRLFGPRSARAFGAAVAIPVASWVSFNVPVGQVTAVEGLLFPMAYAWTCGVIRLLVARTVEDLLVGVGMVGIAIGAAWLLRGGGDSFPGAVLACAVAPLAAFLGGWLHGRSSRRASPLVEAEA